MIDPLLLLPVTALFAVFWVLSALHKVNNFQWFLSVVRDYDLFPHQLTKPIAFFVPVIELLIGSTLLFSTKIGAFATVALLCLYALLLAFNSLRGRQLADCGCGWGLNKNDSAPDKSVHIYIVRNIVLALAASLMFISTAARELTLFDWFNALMATLTLGALLISSTYLYSNFKKMRAAGHV